ncbi:MAG: serine hydrolase [Lacibacter sp.]
MKKHFFLLAVSSLLISACKKALVEHTQTVIIQSPWADTSSKHPKNIQFTALLEKYKMKGLPGISLLVSDANGTWFGATGKADIEKNIAFTPGTVSKVASITKLFTGALVFKLMEDSTSSGLGYNSLNRRISEWLPSKVISHLPNGDKITLGQCMKHETGLPDLITESKFYLAVLNNPNKVWSAEELLEFIYNKEAVFYPGDTAVYSNTNTVLVTMVIEAATGKKHADLLHQKILSPLGLSHTFYQPHNALPSGTAQGYYDLYNNGTIVNVSNLVTGSGNGYGGVFSNIFDMYRFIDALFVKKTLLTHKSLNIMLTYGKMDDPNYYGYGMQKSFLNYADYGLGHKGRDLGYSANLFYFPNKKVVHAFCVNYGTDADSKLKDIFTAFQQEMITLTLQ